MNDHFYDLHVLMLMLCFKNSTDLCAPGKIIVNIIFSVRHYMWSRDCLC